MLHKQIARVLVKENGAVVVVLASITLQLESQSKAAAKHPLISKCAMHVCMNMTYQEFQF